MDFSAKTHSPENTPSNSPENKLNGKRIEEVKDTKEVREASDVGRSAYIEAVGMNESLETTGRVSEIMKEGGEADTSGTSGVVKKTTQKYDPAAIRAALLNNLPSEAVMKKQIEDEIRKEIDYLHKKAIRMFRYPGRVNYFEMTNMMKKIRELKGLLLMLLKASVDSLKTLWLRFVHGMM